jgi:hypothetical protein
MQVSRIVQAVALMLIVALAASCAASKEYSSKLFKPRVETAKDSQTVALRFLELDKLDADKENWVSTDIIMGRDTASNTAALDNLAKTFPASTATVARETSAAIKEDKPALVVTENKPESIVSKTKPVPAADLQVAKNYNTGTRNKKTREDK